MEPISALSAAAETVKEATVEVIKEASEIIKEASPIQDNIEVIENSNLESVKAQNIDKITPKETRNDHLEGKLHPETKVPFQEKLININGEIQKGVFPNFKDFRLFKAKLPESLTKATDSVQFENCNEKLAEAFNKGEIDTNKFTDRQLEQIKNGDKPDGYTWHHNETVGKMELVDSEIHLNTGHTGGKHLWGGSR